MKHALAIFAAIAAAMLLLGCAMPSLGGEPEQPQVVPNQPPTINGGGVLPGLNGTNGTGNATNNTEPEKIIVKNETQEPPVIIKNETDPFSGITPRSVSDRIADGQFRINDIPDAELKIYVIDSGNADSILVNKGEFFMLIDAGDAAKATAFLQKIGVSRINVLVATRDDPIAIGGMKELINGMTVDEFWNSNVPAQSQDYRDILDIVAARKIPVKHPQAGDRMAVSGLGVIALNPQKARLLGNPDTDAVVLKLSTNRFCAILLNPTVQERENALLSGGESLRCDVAAYFRQGSGRPEPSVIFQGSGIKDAIISVGANSDGLPSQTTLTRLAMAGTKVWRTDTNGTILVSTDGLGSYSITAGN